MSTNIPDIKAQNLSVVERYYKAMIEQDFNQMAGCLHENVQFVGPLAELSGKEAVVSAAQGLSKLISRIDIRSKFSADSQVMLAYDFIYPKPIGKLRAAVLMDVKDKLIEKIELFFDSKPFAS